MNQPHRILTILLTVVLTNAVQSQAAKQAVTQKPQKGTTPTSSPASAGSVARAAEEPLVRLKEIVTIRGIRKNVLQGMGLVVGLKGTGDGTVAARESLANFAKRMGRNISSDQLASGNIALVSLSAELPTFPRHGTKLDVQVASTGEATSLRGGTLLLARLNGPTGRNLFALAEGSILIGGFQAVGKNAKTQSNHTTVGYIPDGAICEPAVEDLTPQLLNDAGELEFLLPSRSFSTAVRVEKSINDYLSTRGIGFAKAEDAGLIKIKVDSAYRSRSAVSKLIAELQELQVRPDPISRIILNEKTGTIIIGNNVRISPCMVSISDLTIHVIEDEYVSQPGPGINRGATTEKVNRTSIDVSVANGTPKQVGGQANLSDLIQALQSLGIDGQKMITVLRELHFGRYIHAELVTR